MRQGASRASPHVDLQVMLMYRTPRAALLAATAAIALSACSAAKDAPPPPPAEVSVATVTVGSVQLSDTLPGRVVAARVAEIRPQVSGIIQRRLFTEGATVRAGQALYQINPAPFRADADSAQAALQRAQATLDQARVQRDRLKSLIDVDAVSRKTFDDAEAAVAQAAAEVGVARANLSRRNLDLSFATITAPISGRIGASSITEGALVSAAGGEPLATVHQLDQVYVDVSQPAARLEALRSLGQGSSTVELLDADGKPLGLTGRLLFSEVVVDPGTGDLRARVLVDNASGRLLPGMFVRVRLPRGPEQLLMRAPQQAVVRTQGGAQVLVVKPDGKVEARTVRVGEVVDNQYVIEDGLRAGERVVVEGRDRARPDDTVKTKPWRAAAAPASAAASAAAPVAASAAPAA